MNAIVSGMEVDIDTYRAAARACGRCRCYYGRYGGIRSAGPRNGTRLLTAVCHEYRRSIRRYATVREMEEDPSRSAIKC